MFSVAQVIQDQYPQLANKPLIAKPLIFLLRQLLHETDIRNFVEQYPHLNGIDFVEQVLDYFNVSFSAREEEKARIPTSGKVVIIANHPIGSLDGLALLKLIHSIRPDVKVMANQMLMSVEALHDLLLPVNNMSGGTAKKDMANLHAHLQAERALLVFPAGEVSRLRPQGVRDTHWRSGFLRLAKQHQAPLLPMFIDAKNSPLFYSVSMLYKPLSTVLLVKEMFKQRKAHFPVRIGKQIPPSSYDIPNLPLARVVKLINKHLYKMGHDKGEVLVTQNPIALPENPAVLLRELKTRCQRLGETADNKVIYLYQHNQSSAIMREIGRLREVAFRAVGEGTHAKRDIDQYDSEYYHLVLWDKDECEIVGAYRFGDATKLVTPEANNLYSATLFDYQPEMSPYFAQGLELGRSFVQPKYWGKRALDYLWYGIGAFIRQYPQYRYLFGPVSLSNDYPQPAKQAIIQFYQTYFGGTTDGRPVLAQAKLPFVMKEPPATEFTANDYKTDFANLKHYLSSMGSSVPTLYKQYTEVAEADGVQFHAFNVDPEFNHCIDGLIMVDVTRLKEKKAQRYMGEQNPAAQK
jgi:putative hemolysin